MPRTLFTYQCNFVLVGLIICLAFVFGDPVDAGVREDSLLLTGARSQQLSIVRASLKQGADVDTRDELGRTPLMWSAFHGALTILEILITMRCCGCGHFVCGLHSQGLVWPLRPNLAIIKVPINRKLVVNYKATCTVPTVEVL